MLPDPPAARPADPPGGLLAVDVGLRTGLARFGPDGRLGWYRSQHFGSAAALRRGVPGVLAAADPLDRLVLEGGGPLADVWAKAAERRGLAVVQVPAETWRRVLLLDRQQRTGEAAKRAADALARRIVAWSGAPRPTSLRHDAAEAIAVGFWGALDAGWLPAVPAAVR